MVIKQDGSMWATGYNAYGQQGDGTITDKKLFEKIVDSGVKEVATGQGHSALLNDKDELCVFGYNAQGQLGTGDTTNQIKGWDKKCGPRPGPVTPYGVKGHEECDVDQGEILNAKSSKKTADLAACKKSCEDEVRCQSVTYYYDTTLCNHYSTACEKTKTVFNAIAIRLKDHLNNNEECDVDKGEIRLAKSSGKVSSLAACRKSCRDESACQSITLFADGQCQHFSTKCEKRKFHDGALARRLKDHVANNKECDTSQGEVYMHDASGVLHSQVACMKSCQAVPACNGITFFRQRVVQPLQHWV
jgi:hypothetical protein